MKHLLVILIGILGLVACQTETSDETPERFVMRGDTVIVPESSIVTDKIKTAVINEESYKFELITAGTVKAIPNQYAEIAPPFSGRVSKVYLKLGMKTRPGTPLFEMVAPEFMDAQKVYFQARSELASARLTLKRQQDLKANGVGAERDLEEAETNFQVKEKEYQNAVASLKIFGVNVDKLVFGQPLVITSPIAGEVIENEVVNGHYIKADDPPHAKVAELDKVWVAGMVKEKDIRFISQLSGAEIMVAAYPGRRIIGKVYHINQIVDEATRSVQVLIECANADHTLKPGMYVTVKFIDNPQKTMFVPAKSVLQYNDKSYVFVQTQKGAYMRRYVETGVTDKERIQITTGLTPGETIISEGAFYLLDAK
ncbi:MAG: efflux RND transporter periplasmic adaptor subunit [Runella sp.]